MGVHINYCEVCGQRRVLVARCYSCGVLICVGCVKIVINQGNNYNYCIKCYDNYVKEQGMKGKPYRVKSSVKTMKHDIVTNQTELGICQSCNEEHYIVGNCNTCGILLCCLCRTYSSSTGEILRLCPKCADPDFEKHKQERMEREQKEIQKGRELEKKRLELVRRKAVIAKMDPVMRRFYLVAEESNIETIDSKMEPK